MKGVGSSTGGYPAPYCSTDNPVLYYNRENHGPAATETFFFGKEHWKEHFDFEVSSPLEKPKPLLNHNLILIPSKVNNENYSVNKLRALIEKKPIPFSLSSTLLPSEEFLADESIFIKPLSYSYWCSFSNGKTIDPVDPSTPHFSPTVLEMSTFYAAKIIEKKIEITSNSVWCEETIGRKRFAVGVSANAIRIEAADSVNPLRTYQVVRYLQGP